MDIYLNFPIRLPDVPKDFMEINLIKTLGVSITNTNWLVAFMYIKKGKVHPFTGTEVR